MYSQLKVITFNPVHLEWGSLIKWNLPSKLLFLLNKSFLRYFWAFLTPLMIPPSPPMSCYSQGISAYLFSTTFNKKKTFEGLIRSKKWKNQFFPIFSPTVWYALASPQFCYLSEVDFLHSVGLIVTLNTILWNVGGGWWVRVMISGDPDV